MATDYCQHPARGGSLGDLDQDPGKDITGEEAGQCVCVCVVYIYNSNLLIPSYSHHHGGGRRRDPKEQAEIHAKKRKEREKIAMRGVPEVWASSPLRPDLE